MFYLTYRPKTLSELDNSNVSDTLKNILHAPEVPHALLFVGQKGTGKTSTARIFAKAVNCLQNKFSGVGESYEPCNTCSNCISIEASSSPDVTELDAASNRGIEEVKKLIHESAFAPISGKFRVFIIDEAHMITHDAFNALLKTLEEPPASVIFILATTNEEKVPSTIQSRCHRISFGKAKKEDVISMLRRIMRAEHITAPDDFLEVIATHSDKSFRDATKLLEELVVQNKLTAIEAREYIGVRTKESLIEVLGTQPLKDALQWSNEFSKTGGSIKRLIEELLEELRLVLLSKNGVAVDDVLATPLTVPQVSVLMKLLNEAYGLLKSSPIEAIPLEIALVEFYNYKNRQ
ncbi:DNA polymerase III subunit gamma/tau [Candidatus Roizmanbacteria bacterium]|nr:DNA polymerase III subunit gamma/tau [Candidatus Roizmanbacteria bacterium]